MSSFLFDNMYCGLIRRGDVFVCETEKGKEFPVLVLQDTTLNDGLPTVVCALIELCGSRDEPMVNEVRFEKNEIGLGKPSICLLHKIRTIDRGRMVAKKAEIPPDKLQAVYRALDITCGRFRDRVRE